MSSPTNEEVVQVLRDWIGTLRDSHKVRIGRNKGMIEEAHIRREIECIKRAIAIVRRAK